MREYIVSGGGGGGLSFGVLASATEASLFKGGTYLQGSTNLLGNVAVIECIMGVGSRQASKYEPRSEQFCT